MKAVLSQRTSPISIGIGSEKETRSEIHHEILVLSNILERLRQKDDELFKRIVEAVKSKNNALSIMLGTELTKIRFLESKLRSTIEILYHFRAN